MARESFEYGSRSGREGLTQGYFESAFGSLRDNPIEYAAAPNRMY